MTWINRYHQPKQAIWTGRDDSPDKSCFFQIIHFLNLANNIPAQTPEKIAFALLGFCCDEGVKRNLGRVGAVEGPDAIRAALARLSLQKNNIICYDAGDITCSDGDVEKSQQALAAAVTLLLQHHIVPIILGGGHELAWGHYQGIQSYLPKQPIAVINFDAHFDMRPLLADEKGSSGTPFLQIAKAHENSETTFDYNCIGIQRSSNARELFATAKKYHTQYILADEFYQNNQHKSLELINKVILHHQYIYLSICLDVFASAYAPGVSSPQVMGVTPWQILPCVRLLAASGKVLSYDIAELAPKYDLDQRTAKLAANLVYEIIHHHALGK